MSQHRLVQVASFDQGVMDHFAHLVDGDGQGRSSGERTS
jgi:hypothetical protein